MSISLRGKHDFWSRLRSQGCGNYPKPPRTSEPPMSLGEPPSASEMLPSCSAREMLWIRIPAVPLTVAFGHVMMPEGSAE